MPQFVFEPVASPEAGMRQAIRMLEGEKLVGWAAWHSPLDSEDGVIQILEFGVVEGCRRRGNGKQLMGALVRETLAYQQSRKVPPRRLWVLLRQKRHIIARAFFASQGFTHIATVKDLLTDEDGLAYIRTFD